MRSASLGPVMWRVPGVGYVGIFRDILGYSGIYEHYVFSEESAETEGRRHAHPGIKASPARGASPGSLGPHGGALSGSPWEEKPAGSSLTTLALQPVARAKAQKKHSQTLNLDLSFSDRARSLHAVSIPWAAGTVQARASTDDVLPSSLKAAASATRKRRPPN